MAYPQKYREEAARLRELAHGMSDPVMKKTILEIARLYEQLAESAEKRKKKN
jgi:hypothetical protein